MQGKGANKAFSEHDKRSKRNDDTLKDTVTFVIYLVDPDYLDLFVLRASIFSV